MINAIFSVSFAIEENVLALWPETFAYLSIRASFNSRLM